MNSSKKYIAFLLVLSLIIASLAGCASKTAANNETTTVPGNATTVPGKEKIRIGSLTGPTTLGLLKLYSSTDEGSAEGSYSYQIAGTADELTPLMINGELDVLAGPANLAAVLNAKTEGKIQMIAVTTLGVLDILTQDERVKTWEDLRGRTIYATGKGLTPEYVLNYLLKKNGLEPGKDVNIEFKSEPAEIVALLKSNLEKKPVVMLPQPFATAAQAQAEGLSIIFDLTKEWDRTCEGRLITACLMVRSEFAQQHPEAVKTLLKEYKASAEWVNANTEEAAKLAEKYISIREGVAKKALPLCNIVSIQGSEMKDAVSKYLKVLYDQNPASVGGALPQDSFYYIAQ